MSNEQEKKREILTTKEVAKRLNVKPSTIYKYVKDGKLKPIYDSNWQIDATKLFYADEVAELKKKTAKPGISTGDAAKLLGVHVTTIYLYINNGLLKSEKKVYKGREHYFIEPEELERFKCTYESIRKREKKEFFDKNTGFAWFQAFLDSNGNRNNHILLDEGETPFLFTSDGRKIPLEKIETEGYFPVTPITDIDYITKKGYAKFKFYEAESDTFFFIINLFYRCLGPKNIRITIGPEKCILVEVKPILLKDNIPSEVVQKLNSSIIEGEISIRLDGILITSNIEIITVAVPSELKEHIKKEAEKTKQTIEEVVLSVLNDKFVN